MREVHSNLIMNAVRRLWVEANTVLGEDIRAALSRAAQTDASPLSRELLGRVLENDQLAWTRGLPVCRDTGLASVTVRLGQEVHIIGGFLEDAVNEGLRRGQAEGHFGSVAVSDPIRRATSGEPCPALLRVELTAGDGLEITVAAEGGESENATVLRMLSPAVSREELCAVVTEIVRQAGTTPCPPFLIGVGLGSDAAGAVELSKRALRREVGRQNELDEYAKLEEELTERVNALGIGAQGMGGSVTALDVHVLSAPTHKSCFPCAVSLESYAVRRASEIL